MMTQDTDKNTISADRILSDGCRGDLIISKNKGKLIAVKGLENYMVIDTEDVLLICPKEDKEFKDFIAGIAMPGYEKYR